MKIKKICAKSCQYGNKGFFFGRVYQVEAGLIDGQIRISDDWGFEIVPYKFITENFI